MSSRNTAVFGLYPGESELVDAIDHLKRSGFRTADLSVMVPENLGSNDIGYEKHTKAPEGSVAGFVIGAIAGGALAYLLNSGRLHWPFAGSLSDAGGLLTATPLMAVLAGMAALGAIGALLGAMFGALEPEYETKRYAGRIRNRGALLSVHCDNNSWCTQAKRVLKGTGAKFISNTREAKPDFFDTGRPKLRPSVETQVHHPVLINQTRTEPPLDTMIADTRPRSPEDMHTRAPILPH